MTFLYISESDIDGSVVIYPYMRKLFLFLLGLPGLAIGQEALAPETPARYIRPKYYELGAGLNVSSFKDLATSPLLYTGGSGQFVLGIIRKDSHLESNLSFRFSSGIYASPAELRERAQSVVSSAFISYSRLYQVAISDSDKWNLKVGGKLDLTGNIRQNPSLLNNATGIESFQTLFGSAKISRDISRNDLKRKRFLFVRYKLKPKKRDISYQLNTSVLNTTYRNGYAYINQASIKNSDNFFEDYKFSAFSGFRMSSAIELTRHLPNGNGIKYSYIWDAYKTGGELPKFAMTNHIIQISLLFKVK